MPEKAIFFDLYQTLINVDASREKEGKETGFREIITPFLVGKGVSEAEASLVQQHCNNELNKFYKEHDKELNYHSFPDILTAAFKKHYSLITSDAEMHDLVYEFRKISRGFLHLYEGVNEVLADLSGKYTLSIASHTQGMYTERELEELDIKRYFIRILYFFERPAAGILGTRIRKIITCSCSNYKKGSAGNFHRASVNRMIQAQLNSGTSVLLATTATLARRRSACA